MRAQSILPKKYCYYYYYYYYYYCACVSTVSACVRIYYSKIQNAQCVRAHILFKTRTKLQVKLHRVLKMVQLYNHN